LSRLEIFTRHPSKLGALHNIIHFDFCCSEQSVDSHHQELDSFAVVKRFARRRVTFFACPSFDFGAMRLRSGRSGKVAAKEGAVFCTAHLLIHCYGDFRHAIHGVIEKRRASMRATLRVYEFMGEGSKSKSAARAKRC
jgi:hypothetical protein